MRDVKVRLECVRIAEENYDATDKLEYAKELYDWVVDGDENGVASAVSFEGWDVGYDSGYETAVEVAQDVFELPEVSDITDQYDIGYRDGIRTVLEALKENDPSKAREV